MENSAHGFTEGADLPKNEGITDEELLVLKENERLKLELKQRDKPGTILANHCPIFNPLFADATTRIFREDAIKAMQEYADQETTSLRDQLKQRDELMKDIVENSNFPGCNYSVPPHWRNKIIELLSLSAKTEKE